MLTYQHIIDSLRALNPTHLELINESMNHAGYFEGKESHFKLTIVSDTFNQKRLVARHQAIYSLVHSLMIPQGGSIHALAIHAFTPIEWDALSQKHNTVPASPLCASHKDNKVNLHN